MILKTIVNGAHGKMGKVTVEYIKTQPDFQLVAETDRDDDLGQIIQTTAAEIVVDFTIPSAVFNNAKIILHHGAHPVIGTSGLTEQEIDALTQIAHQRKIGAVIAPNFALGGILMMKLSEYASRFLPNAEIIEMHHEKKVDSPSGTAIKTATMLKSSSDNHAEIPIHSVRLPGLFAHQTVLFGSLGETLTIRHDCIDRQAMMPGVALACRKVMTLDHLVYGLENLI